MSKILAVGSVAYDTIETWAGKQQDILGGSASYFSVCASLLADVSMLAVVGKDFSKSHIELFENKGIDITGLEIAEGKTFSWSGIYPKNGDPKTLRTDLNVFEKFSPSLTEKQKEMDILFLGNIHPKLQLHLVKQMKNTKLVVLDTMNFWIENKKEVLTETIKNIDVLLINETEIKMFTKKEHLIDAVKDVFKLGTKVVIVKYGARGVSMFYKTCDDRNHFIIPATPVEKVIDPTGAGDTFAGGFVSYLASLDKEFSFEDFKTATAYGNIMASFTIEDFGLNKLKEVDKKDLDARLQMFKKYVSF